MQPIIANSFSPYRLLATLVLSFCLATLCYSQSSQPRPATSTTDRYSIAAIPTDQSASHPPLQIIGITGKLNRDFLEQVKVLNISDKTIVRYRLGWHFRNTIPVLRGFEAGTKSCGFALGNPVQAELRTKEIDQAPPQGVLPMDLDEMLAMKGAEERVFILVGVAEVVFADGTRWSGEIPQLNQVWKPGPSASALRD